MKLIVGLGNIGKEYAQTRHNIGFMCVERFAATHNLKSISSYLYKFYRYEDSVMIFPNTYMNNSGDAYKSALSRFKFIEDVLVIMDDIDLPVGQIRARNSGSAGGHNGLKSILAASENKEIKRIRVGIGRASQIKPRDYVLDKFLKVEQEVIDTVLELLEQWIELYINTDFNTLLDEYSKWMKKPIPSQEDGIKRPKEEKND